KAPVKQLPEIPAGTLKEPPALVMPDLVIEDFSVDTAGKQIHGREAWYPMTARIGNLGTRPVTEPFYIAFELVYGAQGQWQPDRTEPHAQKIDRNVMPDQWLNVSGFVKLDTAALSDTSVQVRAVVDSLEFEEFPPEGGRIKESDESNNYSNSVTIQGGYLPDVSGINKSSVVRGVDEVMLTGTGFGAPHADRTVVVEKDGQKSAADVRQWTAGGILFTVPENARTGQSMVYIGDSSTLTRLSVDSQPLLVVARKELPWWKVINGFNYLFSGAFSIRLHTWTGGSKYQNFSELTVYGDEEPTVVNVPLVQFKTDVGYYRFLVNDLKSFDFNSNEQGFSMNREGCAPNQLLLTIQFESEGEELIGYYKVLGPAGEWRRTGAPDIQVNNAVVTIRFQFFDAGGGRLDYQAAASFSGEVQASGSVWNNILDFFMEGWDKKLKREVSRSVRAAINEVATREQVCLSLVDSMRLLLGMRGADVITGYGFSQSGIQVTYY
ncbi:MAG: hypothetical protein ACP5DY_08635, partial [Thermovirgaceae bacterium]